MSETDRRWFKRNPDANIRFRQAAPDEAGQLLRLVHPEFDQALSGLADQAGLTLSVAVVKTPDGHCVRFPIARDRSPDLERQEGVVFALVCVGRQVVMG